jgi:uncharacterized protein
MRRSPKAWLGAVLAIMLVVAGVVAFAVARRSPTLHRLVIAAGAPGGVYHAYAEGIATAAKAAYPGVHTEVLVTAASVENLRLVAAGDADVAFSLADSSALAVSGSAPFTEPQPLSAVARLYSNYTQLVVRAGSSIDSVYDLRGRAVSIGAQGSGTELLAARILAAAGLNPTTDVRSLGMDLGDSVKALQSGGIDALFFSGGLPTPAIATLASQTPVRLLNLADFVPTLSAAYGPFYNARTIPAASYGAGTEVQTIGVPNYLVVRAGMPDDEAFALTQLLFSAKSTLVAAHSEALHLDLRAAVETFPMQLHPGAVEYYRRTKP